MKGFTLIEILIVFAFIGILTVLGIASYSTYTSAQTVNSSASDVATMLSTAKSNSLSQVIPNSCGANPVTGYQVDIIVGGQQFVLSAVCTGLQRISSSKLPTPVKFASGSTATVFFPISTGMPSAAATISVTGYGKTKTITVTQTGAITVN